MLTESAQYLVRKTAGTQFFDNSEEIQKKENELLNRNALKSIFSYCRLFNLSLSVEEYSDFRTRAFSTKGGNTYNLIIDQFPERLWRRLHLQSHQVAKHDEQQLDTLNAAIEHIEDVHGYAMDVFNEFVHNIAWLDLRPDFRNRDHLITSVSLPAFPFSVFVSRKALVHIPPNTVSKQPSIRFLAENLVHESIHHQVNATLLETEVLPDTYDSRSSPKVEIGWRLDQDVERNKYWELDRVIHAIAVYVTLMRFRCVEIETGHETDFEHPYFVKALTEGIDALDYLSTRILDYKSNFTSHGVELLNGLREDAIREIDHARQLIRRQA